MSFSSFNFLCVGYAVQIWSPYYKMDKFLREYPIFVWTMQCKFGLLTIGWTNSLESIQRRMTKMFHNIRNRPYEDGLRDLKLNF